MQSSMVFCSPMKTVPVYSVGPRWVYLRKDKEPSAMTIEVFFRILSKK